MNVNYDYTHSHSRSFSANPPREVKARIISVETISLSKTIIRMRLIIEHENNNTSFTFDPGQFAYVSVPNTTLRRPLAIANLESGTDHSELEFIFQIVGEGTYRLALQPVGTEVSILLPLGHGWPMHEVMSVLNGGGKVWLVGGGLGIVSLVPCAKQIVMANTKFDIASFIGFQDQAHLFETEYIQDCGPSTIQIDGLITDPLAGSLETHRRKPDLLLACGPKPFLKALQGLCLQHDIRAFASFEENMGCGIGACLSCCCGVRANDQDKGQGAGSVHYIRVCREGPVLNLGEVIFDERA